LTRHQQYLLPSEECQGALLPLRKTRRPAVSAAWLSDLFDSRTFVHGQVISLVALDQILRLFFRSVDCVSLKGDFGGNSFPDGSPNAARFRVPFNVIANLEVVRHK